MPRAGERVAYRPMPACFAETFIRLGWEGTVKELRAHPRTVVRWVDDTGREDLLAKRRAYLRKHGRAKASNYVMGTRLTPRRLMAMVIDPDTKD